MDENIFWKLVTNNSHLSLENHNENIIKELSNFSQQDILKFELIMRDRLIEIYNWNVLATFELLHPSPIFLEEGKPWEKQIDYFSNDGFLYYRCWCLSQGKEFCATLVNNPNEILKNNINFKDNWFESLIYVSRASLKLKKINEDLIDTLPNETHYDTGNFEMTGKKWKVNDIEKIYPALASYFNYKRPTSEMGKYLPK